MAEWSEAALAEFDVAAWSSPSVHESASERLITGATAKPWLGVGVSIDIMYTDASGTIAARGWVCTGLVRVVCKLQLV